MGASPTRGGREGTALFSKIKGLALKRKVSTDEFSSISCLTGIRESESVSSLGIREHQHSESGKDFNIVSCV